MKLFSNTDPAVIERRILDREVDEAERNIVARQIHDWQNPDELDDLREKVEELEKENGEMETQIAQLEAEAQ